MFDESTVGKLPITYNMKLDPNVKPVVMPPRQIPLAVKERVKKELQRMEEKGIIAKVHKPTEWVSALVAAKKKDKDANSAVVKEAQGVRKSEGARKTRKFFLASFVNYIEATKDELKKVTWLPKSTVVNYVAIVVFLSALFTLYVAFVDYGLAKIFKWLNLVI